MNLRGLQWKPHFLLPQTYLKYLQNEMEKVFNSVKNLNVDGLSQTTKLKKAQYNMKMWLEKSKRSRYFDHVEYLRYLDLFYSEYRRFIETLWRLKLKKEL